MSFGMGEQVVRLSIGFSSHKRGKRSQIRPFLDFIPLVSDCCIALAIVLFLFLVSSFKAQFCHCKRRSLIHPAPTIYRDSILLRSLKNSVLTPDISHSAFLVRCFAGRILHLHLRRQATRVFLDILAN